MLRFLDPANSITLLGLVAALAAVLLAIEGRQHPSFVALVVAGLCDLFDGLVARRLGRDDQARAFGGHLDSLVDACSFGLAPAVMLYALGLRSPAEVFALGLLPVAAVWRLAWFETCGLAVRGDARYYTGMPVTYVALLLPLGALVGLVDADQLRPTLAATAVLAAALMVSRLRFRKPHGFWYPFLLVLAVAVVLLHLQAAARGTAVLTK